MNSILYSPSPEVGKPWFEPIIAGAGRLAAFGTTMLILSAGNFSPDTVSAKSQDQVPIVENIPNAEELKHLGRFYEEFIAKEDWPKTYDSEESTESAKVYRYPGLEDLSFTLPAEKVLETIATTKDIDELERTTAAYFESFGIKLYMTQAYPVASGYEFTPLQHADLEQARASIQNVMSQMSIIPREVIELANIQSVIFASRMIVEIKGEQVGVTGFSQYPDGNIVLDVNQSTDQSEIWRHEMGHLVAMTLEKVTEGKFLKQYQALNPNWFNYVEQLQEMGIAQTTYEAIRHSAIQDHVISRDRSGDNVYENAADDFGSLWLPANEPGVENPSDLNITTLGLKRVLWTEMLEKVAPGSKAYLSGSSVTTKDGDNRVEGTQPADSAFTLSVEQPAAKR